MYMILHSERMFKNKYSFAANLAAKPAIWPLPFLLQTVCPAALFSGRRTGEPERLKAGTPACVSGSRAGRGNRKRRSSAAAFFGSVYVNLHRQFPGFDILFFDRSEDLPVFLQDCGQITLISVRVRGFVFEEVLI